MSAARLRRPEPGFVLVGVVIIVLALTILGLSLFSLSSYEAQFMQRSLDRQQALQSALGGLDRARYALIAKNQTLDQVKVGLPIDSVFYTRAMQFNGAVMDSAGAVDWGGNDIHVESAATVNGITRWAAGDFVPHQTVNWYSRVMTLASVSASFQVHLDPDPLTGLPTRVRPSLADSIWQRDFDTSWISLVLGMVLGNVVPNVPVPVPNASGFIAVHDLAHGAQPVLVGGASYTLHAPEGGPPAYWYTDLPPASPARFSFYDVDHSVATNHQIHVTGRAIWCLPRGVRFDKAVEVFSDGDPTKECLVIVASNGDDGQNPGAIPRPFDDLGAIWFFSGLISHQVPVILVSDGIVKIEAMGDIGAISDVAHLSIFASQAFAKGPTLGAGHYMSLTYGNRVAMQAQLDFLFSFGALPNSSAPNSTQLSLRPGTWRVTQ